MSGRWWRAYDRSRRDPKLQRLQAETFRGWYNLVCLASENGGALPALDVIAFEIRKSEQATLQLLKSLEAVELFECVDGTWRPRKWNDLQYKSDVSTDRVKAFRERQRNVSETPSENREQRTETEKTDSGADAPCASDDVRVAFEEFTKAAADCNWPKPRALEADRRKKLKARLDEHGLDGWRQVIAIARESDFLRTKFPLKLDWVLEPKNFRKVLEGNYGAAASVSTPTPSNDEVLWEARFRNYYPGGLWQETTWGPRPESGRCHAPPPVLERWRGRVAQ